MQPVLTRVDFRLIHGQVVTYWIPSLGIEHIVLVNDSVKHDYSVMQIMQYTKPLNCSISFYTLDEAVELWNEEKLMRKEKRNLLLFESITDVYYCFEKGMKIENLQLGNLPFGPGKTNISSMYFLSDEEAACLEKMSLKGMDIVFNATGNIKITDWSSVRNRYFKDLNI